MTKNLKGEESTITIFNSKTKKEEKMKKLILTMFLVLVAAFVFYGVADAAVSGQCGSCHTMHNSQDGSAVDSGGPNATLLRADCLGCHIAAAAAGAPQIAENDADGVSAGTFNELIVLSDGYAHNVHELSASADTDLYAGSVDGKHGDTPPGGSDMGQMLSCAGTYGCHGDHSVGTSSIAAMNGFHHGGTAYKFLTAEAGANASGTDVKGERSTDWEESGGANSGNHNSYSSDATQGISQFCNSCHDDFHGTGAGETGTASPWERHPTDVALSLLGSTTSMTISYSTTPFAFDSPGSSTASYDTSGAEVMCLSCHRAHGTDQRDMLRFTYSSITAGSGGTTGCLACHVNQR